MLTSLQIRDFAIIDAVEVEWRGGLTVLTGETGAGKSIVVDALQLLAGGRAGAEVVRHGAARAEVGSTTAAATVGATSVVDAAAGRAAALGAPPPVGKLNDATDGVSVRRCGMALESRPLTTATPPNPAASPTAATSTTRPIRRRGASRQGFVTTSSPSPGVSGCSTAGRRADDRKAKEGECAL